MKARNEKIITDYEVNLARKEGDKIINNIETYKVMLDKICNKYYQILKDDIN